MFTIHAAEWASYASIENLLILDAMTDLSVHKPSFFNEAT